MSPPFHLSSHARLTAAHRGISVDWIARVLAHPARTHPDPDDPELLHALGVIPEFGSRVLRVVYNPRVDPPRVVTAFFDRSMRGKL